MQVNQFVWDDYDVQRLGKFTGSEIHRLLSEPKEVAKKQAGELSADANLYVLEKCAELLTCSRRTFSSAATDWGNEQEEHAIAELEKQYPGIVHYGQTNRKFFPFGQSAGSSPDAIHGGSLVFEIKCPENPVNHVRYMLMKTAAQLKKTRPDYYFQIQFNMLCVSVEIQMHFDEMRGMFVSYCPLMDDNMKLHRIDVVPEPGFRELVEEKILKAEKVRNGILLAIEPKQ